MGYFTFFGTILPLVKDKTRVSLGGLMKLKVFTLIIALLTVSTSVMPDSHLRECHLEWITGMMKKLEARTDDNRAQLIAQNILDAAQKYNVDPKIVLSIIDTESDFREGMVSYTGDVSLVQINPKIWNREFARMKKPLLSSSKLKKDEAYAIEKMCEILSILKNRYSDADAKWFARYHSRTKKFKNLYSAKVESRLNLINQI
jgi:soluble lytic murein transglycosylase-like protein